LLALGEYARQRDQIGTFSDQLKAAQAAASLQDLNRKRAQAYKQAQLDLERQQLELQRTRLEVARMEMELEARKKKAASKRKRRKDTD
jgi:hypothetical protein